MLRRSERFVPPQGIQFQEWRRASPKLESWEDEAAAAPVDGPEAPREVVDIPRAVERMPRLDDIRELRITRRILEQYGYSEGCIGCEHAQLPPELGAGKRLHTPACRQRIYEALAHDEADKHMLDKVLDRMNRKPGAPSVQGAAIPQQLPDPGSAPAAQPSTPPLAGPEPHAPEVANDQVQDDEHAEVEEPEADMPDDMPDYSPTPPASPIAEEEDLVNDVNDNAADPLVVDGIPLGMEGDQDPAEDAQPEATADASSDQDDILDSSNATIANPYFQKSI